MNKTTNNYVVVTKTEIIGYCVEKRDAEVLKEKGRSRAIFDLKRGEMVNTGGIKSTVTLKEYCKCFVKMLTN